MLLFFYSPAVPTAYSDLLLFCSHCSSCWRRDTFGCPPRSVVDALQDKTFQFEKRRDVVPKYNRDLMHATLYAMKRVQEIRVKRQQRFWEKRQDAAKEQQRESAVREIEKNKALLPPVIEKEKKKARVGVAKAEQMQMDS